MTFEQVWAQYDFTESVIVGMRWEAPLTYVLHLNYYWPLRPSGDPSQPTLHDQYVQVLLRDCVRLMLSFTAPLRSVDGAQHFGTITGWERIVSSAWIEAAPDPATWLHLIFYVGSADRIEALCRSIDVQPL
jgi:hypothetical protein